MVIEKNYDLCMIGSPTSTMMRGFKFAYLSRIKKSFFQKNIVTSNFPNKKTANAQFN